MTKKQSLRNALIAKRQEIGSHEVKDFNKKIVNNCIKLIDWKNVNNIHVYLPIKKFNEITTCPLIRYIWVNHPHIKIYAPKSEGYSRLRPRTKLSSGHFGNLEPKGKISIVKHFDIVIAPVVGFDSGGFRLGYGFGYYDRFLSSQSYSYSIGLAYSFCKIEPSLPRQQHDIPLDLIIVE